MRIPRTLGGRERKPSWLIPYLLLRSPAKKGGGGGGRADEGFG